MSVHTTRVNNFIQAENKSNIDVLSKIYITLQSALGLNRIGVFCKKTFLNLLSILYVIICVSFICFFTVTCASREHISAVEYMKLMQYVICCFLGFASRKRLKRFYEELERFDKEIRRKPKVCRESVVTLISMTAICFSLIPVYNDMVLLAFIPTHTIQIIENHYYGFLFILLNQRLRSVNELVESSLYHSTLSAVSKGEEIATSDDENKEAQVTVNNLMDYYYVIISAYDQLTDAIKWQLLFIVISSFMYTLCISYHIALSVLHRFSQDAIIHHTVLDILLVSSEMLPLITPCMCCDMVRHQVRRLRELLASKLFESKLDKTNRSVARALLTLTKARNLSFSLMRMVDVSISLPFSFLGLLATYLIILLQFEKVINPNEDMQTSTPKEYKY